MSSELTPSTVELTPEEAKEFLESEEGLAQTQAILNKVLGMVAKAEDDLYPLTNEQVSGAMRIFATLLSGELLQRERYQQALAYERTLFDRFAAQCTCGAAYVCKGTPPMSIREVLALTDSYN